MTDESSAQANYALNPEHPFDRVLIELAQNFHSKNDDYSGTTQQGTRDDILQNFYDSAYQTGLSAGHSIESLIATKQGRLRVLLGKFWRKEGKPNNESIRDTLLDRAAYSVMGLMAWDEDAYIPAWDIDGNSIEFQIKAISFDSESEDVRFTGEFQA